MSSITLASLNINPNFSFFSTVPDTHSQSENSTLDDIKLRNQQLQKQQQDNQTNNQLYGKALQASLDKLASLSTHFDSSASTTQEDRLNEFMLASNQLQEHLGGSNLDPSLLHKTSAFARDSLLAMSPEESDENRTKSFTKNITLINQGHELVHELNKQAAVKLPLAETFSSRSAIIGSADNEHDNTTDQPKADAGGATHSYSSADINTYLVMLDIVLITNTMVMNAVSVESQMNSVLQDMMTQLQQYLALVTIVNKAFKDMQAQAALENSNNNNLNPGWSDKTTDGSYDMYNLLTGKKDDGSAIPQGSDDKKNLPVLPDWAGKISRSPNSLGGTISICFYEGNDPSPLLTQFPGAKQGDKYFLTQANMQTLLDNIGSSMNKFTGGNLATQNSMAFAGGITLEGLINAIGAATTSLQSQSTASTSKLGIDNQGLVAAISNFVTLISNLLSVMMKLFSIG